MDASFQASATYRVVSTGEPDGTLVSFPVTVYGGYYDRSDVTYVSPTYTLPGLGSFTQTAAERTHTITAKVGERITFSVAGNVSQSGGPGPNHTTLGNVLLAFDPTVTTQLPDLATNPASGLSVRPDGTGINYTYSVLGEEPPGGVPVTFYWATGPDEADIISAAYSTTLTGADATVGSHTKSVTWADLGTRPADATHLVMVLDPDDAVAEASETNNVAGIQLPSVGGGITGVTANYDEDGNGDTVFGKYLPGVNLNTTFTVTTDDPDGVIASVKYTIDGRGGNATKAGDNWVFSRNVGQLTKGTHTLVVTAYDSAGQKVGTPFTGTIVVGGQPDFEVTVDGIESENVRFIGGIATPVTFHGTIDDLPDYYVNRLNFTLGSVGIPITATDTGDGAEFDVQYTVKNLKAGLTDAKLLVGAIPVTTFGDAAEKVRSSNIPKWLQGGTWTFEDGEYSVEGAKVDVLSLAIRPPKVGIDWVDEALAKYTSSLRIQPVIDITAPLDLTQPVEFEGTELQTEAVLLGETLWEKTYTATDLDIGGTLDSKTLEANGFYVRLKQPEVLANATFLDKTFRIPVVSGAGSALVTATLDVGLKLTGELTADAGIEITSGKNGAVLVAGAPGSRAGTFVTVTGTATGVGILSATAQIAKGTLLNLQAGGEVTANLSLEGTARFGGRLTRPTLSSYGVKAEFWGNYEYWLKADVLKGTITVLDYDSTAPENGGTEDDTFGPFTLLDIRG